MNPDWDNKNHTIGEQVAPHLLTGARPAQRTNREQKQNTRIV